MSNSYKEEALVRFYVYGMMCSSIAQWSLTEVVSPPWRNFGISGGGGAIILKGALSFFKLGD
jgi:hypothetical protein